MPSEFVFRITAMDAEVLMPQVSNALEMYNEQESRKQHPGIWRAMDRMNLSTKASGSVSPKRRTWRMGLATLCWILGMYLLVPAVSAQTQMSFLLAVGVMSMTVGAVFLWNGQRTLLAVLSMLSALFLCVVAYGTPEEFGKLMPLGVGLAVFSTVCLLTGKRKHENPYDRAAKQLLTPHTDPEMLERVRFTISDQGLTVGVADQPGEQHTVPLEQVSCVFETEDLLLPVYAGSITVLQKRDLMTGTLPELREFLADRLVQTGL